MKKTTFLSLISCCLISLAACGSAGSSSDTSSASPEQTELSSESEPSGASGGETAPEESGPSGASGGEAAPEGNGLDVFQKEAAISETVLYEKNGVKITASDLSYTAYSADLALTIENSSEKDLSILSETMGYSCNSVNGYMIYDGYLDCDVAAGKSASDVISFSYDNLMLYGIHEIAVMELGFDISDDDFNDIYTGPLRLETSAFASYDDSGNSYLKTITSPALTRAFDYEIPYSSDENLYEESGIRHLSTALMKNSDGKSTVLLELENTTDSQVFVASSDLALNGLVVCSSLWSTEAINPGCRCVIDYDTSLMLDPSYWDALGIEEVGSLSLSLTQINPDGNEITEAVPVNIKIPGAGEAYDTDGAEIYNDHGIRILYKDILPDPNDTGDLHVLLLAENSSGKTMSLDGDSGSLSVNDFMTDCLFDSTELKNGENGLLEIELMQSSLEDNSVTSASDISRMDFTLEITDPDYNDTEAKIHIDL